MKKNNSARAKLWAFGVGLMTITATFLVIQINPLFVAGTYLALLGLVIAVGLATNFVGGLLASAGSVFIIILANQYLGIYPRESFVVNIATELTAFLLVGPLAGFLSNSVEEVQRQADHWLAQSEEHAIHDETLGTLKPEWAKVRLQEEVLRARQFTRPISLVLMQVEPNADLTNAKPNRAERVAILQAIIRLARATTPAPAVVTHTGGGQVLIILPEHTPEQADTISAKLCQQAEREMYFPDTNDKSLGKPIRQWGQLRTAIASLNGKAQSAEELLAQANSALDGKHV